VTVEQARALGLDLVVASVDHNHEGFHRFATENGATFGIHLGNVRWNDTQDRWDLADLALVSTKLPFVPSVPFAIVRQSSASTTSTGAAAARRAVRRRVVRQLLRRERPGLRPLPRGGGHGPRVRLARLRLVRLAPEDEYAAGNIGRCADVAAAMRRPTSPGTRSAGPTLRHVIHNLFAVGRPVLGIASYYATSSRGPSGSRA